MLNGILRVRETTAVVTLIELPCLLQACKQCHIKLFYNFCLKNRKLISSVIATLPVAYVNLNTGKALIFPVCTRIRKTIHNNKSGKPNANKKKPTY
jgi:hypothetical protein